MKTLNYGEWEGMHATPSEIALTQAVGRVITHPMAQDPPEALPEGYLTAHAGDKHGPPDAHRAQFPDGRVGSHSALATPEDGAFPEHAAKITVDAVTARQWRSGLRLICSMRSRRRSLALKIARGFSI